MTSRTVNVHEAKTHFQRRLKTKPCSGGYALPHRDPLDSDLQACRARSAQ